MADSEIELTLTPPASIRVLMPSGQVEEMKLETYLAGAIAAEIGEKAPLEALKAQAVASRTYVVAAERHREQQARVCTLAHCQKWQRVDPVSSPEVFRALSETWGMVAVYQGELIHTFFFEHCDGHTRNAEEMLIPAADYLRGVDCSCGHLTLKGHGVGMCKRGAIVMARRGASFAQILRHYYRGVVVGRMMALPEIAPALEEPAPPHAAEASKKPRPRRIVRENAPMAAKPTKVEREPVKPQAYSRPSTPPEKTVAPKRPLLKRVTLPNLWQSNKPAADKSTLKPIEIETPPAAPVEEAHRKDATAKTVAPIEPKANVSPGVAPVKPPADGEMNRENFVVVAKVVEPIKPKPVELPPPDGEAHREKLVVVAKVVTPSKLETVDTPRAATEPVATDEIVIQPSQEKSEQTEPATAIEDEAVDLQPSPVPDQEKQTEVAVIQPDQVTRQEETNIDNTQAITAQTSQPVIDAPVIVTPLKLEPVLETALPPLEGIAIKPIRRLRVDHLPGTRMIAGNLPRAGISVVIEDSRGNQTLVFSGTVPHYGAGGFETIVDEDGSYRVLIEGQTIEVKLNGETAFIHAG